MKTTFLHIMSSQRKVWSDLRHICILILLFNFFHLSAKLTNCMRQNLPSFFVISWPMEVGFPPFLWYFLCGHYVLSLSASEAVQTPPIWSELLNTNMFKKLATITKLQRLIPHQHDAPTYKINSFIYQTQFAELPFFTLLLFQKRSQIISKVLPGRKTTNLAFFVW